MLLPGPTPLEPMPHDPIGQGMLKPDIATRLLGLQPFVTEDFLSFCLELAVERRALYQLGSTSKPGFVSRHNSLNTSAINTS
jgi:hypothetical protein